MVWSLPWLTSNRTKMYNTGDIGLWLPDGTVQVQGRYDDQVKIKVGVHLLPKQGSN